MIVPPEKRGVIAMILADYLERPFSTSGDFRSIARAHHAVPAFENWTSITFLRTDGTFFNYDTEENPGQITPETNEIWQLSALSYAARKHPRFNELLPARPANARPCDSCGGAGWIAPSKATEIVCGECGGLGWRTRGSDA
jgi:hypothetical protein